MRWLVILLVVGCGDSPGKTTARSEPTLEVFERRMCACRDSACARQVVGEMAAWSKKVRSVPEDPEKSAQIMKRYNACMAEAASQTSTPR